MPWPSCNDVPPGHIHTPQCPVPACVQSGELPCPPNAAPTSGNGGTCSRSIHSPLGTIKRPPEFARHRTTLSACPCNLLQSRLCTQWTASGAPSPQQLLSLLGFPPTCQDLTRSPSPFCQGGRVLHAPWGMHLTQGTCKRSPETSACGVHCNCRITNPLRSHRHS